MRRITLALAAALLFAPSVQAEPQSTYEVVVVLSQAGRTVAAPSIRLAVGGEARMEVADAYRIDASLHSAAGGGMLFETQVSRPDGSDWVVEAHPSISVNPEGEATMRVSGASWDQIEVTVRPVG